MSLRHLTNIALLASSTLLSILAAEMLARVFVSFPTFRTLLAVQETPVHTVDGVTLWTDKHPLYDGEDIRRLSAEMDAFKVLGLGDSILYGVSVPREQNYLEEMRRLLAGRVERRIEIINAAVPGYNTLQEDATYREIGQQIKPDLVLVHYWEDDAHQYRVVGGYVVDFGDISDEGGRLVARALPLPERLGDFLLLHSQLYGLLTQVVLANRQELQANDWTRVSQPLGDIQRRVENGGGRLLVLASPRLDGEMPRPNGDLPRLRQFASTRGIEVIDVSDWLDGAASKEIALDGCHFNAQGHRLLGQHLADYLLQHDLKRP